MKSPFLLVLSIACLLTVPLLANDWPQFRYDAGRTAASPHELPTELQLRWTRSCGLPVLTVHGQPRRFGDSRYSGAQYSIHGQSIPGPSHNRACAVDAPGSSQEMLRLGGDSNRRLTEG